MNAIQTPRYTVEQARQELIKCCKSRNSDKFAVELVKPEDAASILNDSKNHIEGNYPVYRVTEPEGNVWYWDGLCFPG